MPKRDLHSTELSIIFTASVISVVVAVAVVVSVAVLRGATVNRTSGTHKKLPISLFVLTIFGPIYYGPP